MSLLFVDFNYTEKLIAEELNTTHENIIAERVGDSQYKIYFEDDIYELVRHGKKIDSLTKITSDK